MSNMAVNVSAIQFLQKGFSKQVAAILSETGLEPDVLELELTESILINDETIVLDVLRSLKKIGVQLAIDDFGTGYSSLAYLQQLPVSELKIDRSFIIDIDSKPASQQLARTMIEMGHGLGLLVTAEGIETQAERDTLKHLGCDVMQGYFGSRPLFANNLQTWLDQVEAINAPG